MYKAAFTIYLCILVMSPLLFGAVHTYAYTLMTLAVIAATSLLVIKNIIRNPKTDQYHFRFPHTSLNFALLLLLILLILQIVPLPDSIIEFLSPEAKVVGQKSISPTHTLFTDNQRKELFTLAPFHYPVRMSIIRFTAYGLFFLGLTQLLNSQKRIEITILLILITGCFDAIYGLAQTYSGSAHIWWFRKIRYQQDVTGTYINHNHFAGFMEMCLLLAATYAAGLSMRNHTRKMTSRPITSLRGRFARYLSSGEQLHNKRTLILFSGVVVGLGLVFSASRGGIIAAAGGMLCMSLLFVFRKDHRRKGALLFCLFLVTLVYASFIGVEYPLERFKYFDRDFEARSRLAWKTMDIFRDYKLTGIGLGNFQYAYPKYQAAENKKVFIQHAHNDWAQFLAEGGITGLCLLLAGMSYFIYRVLLLWKDRRDHFAVCVGIAPLPVMTAVGIHAYSDFNLHIPANFLMLSAIVATGYSALHLRRHHSSDKTFQSYYMIPLRYKGILFLAMLVGLISWTGYWTVRHFVAEAYCNTVPNSTLNRDQNPSLDEINNAIHWDQCNAQYHFKLAQELRRIQDSEILNPNTDVDDLRQRQREIVSALETAVRLNPFQAKYHLRLGFEYTYLWWDPDYYEKWLPSADLSMERAAYFAGEKNPRLHVDLGNYWVMRSKIFYPNDPRRESSWIKACWHYKKAQSLEMRKSLTDEITTYVRIFYQDPKVIREVVLSDLR